MAIKKTYITIGLIWTTVSAICAQPVRDSLSVSPQWHILKNHKLSSNGNWAVIYKSYEYNSDTLYVVNTKSKEKITLTNLNHIDFLNNILIGTHKTDNTILNRINLETRHTTVTDNIQKYNILQKQNSISYLKRDSHNFHIGKLKKTGTIQTFQTDSVADYYLNEKQSYALLIKKNKTNYNLYGLNLKSLELSYLSQTNSSIHQIIWNQNQEQLLAVTQTKKLILSDLKNKTTHIIETDIPQKSIIKIDGVFINTTKCYIRIQEDTGIKNNYSEILEKWNGNDKNLHFLQNQRAGNIYKQHCFVYNIKNNKMRRLNYNSNFTTVITENPSTLLLVDRLKHKDYTNYTAPVDIYSYDIKDESLNLITEQIKNVNSNFSYSPNGDRTAYKKDRQWNIYNNLKGTIFKIKSISNQQQLFWSNKSDEIYVIGDNNFWHINLTTERIKQLTNFKTENSLTLNVLNYKQRNSNIHTPDINAPLYVDTENNILLNRIDNNNNFHSIWEINKNKKAKVLYETPNKISSINWSDNNKIISFTEENYNLPPIVKVIDNNRLADLLKSNLPKTLYNWRLQKIINYTDKYNTPLKGILFYPKNFNSLRKYPMITHVYQKQYALANNFYLSTFQNSTGFNTSLLTELGYFVFLPDIVISDEGPGLAAVDCVTKSIEAITEEEPAIDTQKLGLIGHSFGGYETNFIITQTNLFAAAVSGAAISDIIQNYYSYNYDYNTPSYWKFENGQYQMQVPFSKNKEFYLKNSPILYVDQTSTPLLSWTGLEDYNVHWEHTRHFYIALKRYKIPNIALFYKKEGHALSSKTTTKDLTIRTINWFDYFLKDNKNIEWITQGIKQN